MDSISDMDGRLRAGVRRSARLWLALVLALGSCSIETEPGPGPGALDSSVGGGRDAASDDAGGSSGDAGEDAGSGGGGGRAGGQAGASGAGTGGGGEAGAPACDETQSPSDEPCLVDDDRALFVARDGDDDADGTMAEPLATLTVAVRKAAQAGIDRVIVCGDTYEQTLVVENAVSVHGGFECDRSPWRYTQAPTALQPASAGEALRIDDVAGRVTIEDVQFAARDATSPGGSSIAAIVRDSADVVLRRVQLSAGAGASGTAGITQAFAFPKTGAVGDECGDPTMMCLAGYAAISTSGGADRTYTCPAGDVTVGGLGGDSVPSAAAGQPGMPSLGAGGGGPGGPSCGSGIDGAAGGQGPLGAGAAVSGIVDDVVWTPASGGDGMPGSVGQGGGGGGAKEATGGGGGGGAGGCGGAGGAGGQGGGASIALLSVGSSVTLDTCTLQTGAGGDGGSGSDGQVGMASGGIGGAGASCGGGVGGAGGKGGAGGGGAGGISVGVLWTDTEPMLDDTDFDLGAPGHGGAGGDAASVADDGIDGNAVEMLAM